MKQYVEKLGLSAADAADADGGAVSTGMNQLNERYMRLTAQLYQRLVRIKRVYDDVGIYFPVSLS